MHTVTLNIVDKDFLISLRIFYKKRDPGTHLNSKQIINNFVFHIKLILGGKLLKL